MAAHAADLRAEVDRELDGSDGKAFAADIAAQGSEAAPTARLRALLQFAERLALMPGSVEQQHTDELRAHGLDDRAIGDAVQIVSYFAYINRIADGLGVDLEPEMT